jgi:hypothetical protein
MFLEELKERESTDAESRDEPPQGAHAPRRLLHIMEALKRLHLCDTRHLIWVRVNTVMGDHIPE